MLSWSFDIPATLAGRPGAERPRRRWVSTGSSPSALGWGRWRAVLAAASTGTLSSSLWL